ncbi:hypothetical protein [Streptomyces canus]|uniref:hypothetical protein n=1 Tax=Streptomyces canus TaxID=58343 RepID=UPI0032498AA4
MGSGTAGVPTDMGPRGTIPLSPRPAVRHRLALVDDGGGSEIVAHPFPTSARLL